MALNLGCTYRHQVGMRMADAPATLVDYLARVFAHSDATAWRARVACGEIDVDGRRAEGDAALRAGQLITWRRPPWDEPEVPMGWRVVFEDDWLLAVDKPSGLPTMPAGGFLEHTLLLLVRRERPGASALHRLGRSTSGLVLFARDHESAARLSRAWREHRVAKRYRALASGIVGWETRDIDVAIGPVAHPRLGSVHAASAGGRPAQSTVRVVERRAGTTLVDVDIRTGRPHQVRIHLAWAGHPLEGDPLFVAGGVPRADDPALPGAGGYLLHASRLAFDHPLTGSPTVLDCPPPPPLQVGAGRGLTPGVMGSDPR
jgi:23S rRNA pseudouridine1911/1915/1917 synthase